MPQGKGTYGSQVGRPPKRSALYQKSSGRPGTDSPLHKATKAPVVSSARTKADASLVHAGQELGKSYIPGAIDYSIKTRYIDPDNDDKKKKRDIDETGADKGSESRSKWNKRKAKSSKKLEKKKNRGAEDIPQDWNDPGIAINDGSSTDSAFTQRNNKTLKRIYRNAIPGGSVRKNLIKKGFDPKK